MKLVLFLMGAKHIRARGRRVATHRRHGHCCVVRLHHVKNVDQKRCACPLYRMPVDDQTNGRDTFSLTECEYGLVRGPIDHDARCGGPRYDQQSNEERPRYEQAAGVRLGKTAPEPAIAGQTGGTTTPSTVEEQLKELKWVKSDARRALDLGHGKELRGNEYNDWMAGNGGAIEADRAGECGALC